MFLKINNLEEMQKYYNAHVNKYYFFENGLYLDVEFVFNLKVESDIKAKNIKANCIDCRDINCCDITSNYIDCRDINCRDINCRDIDCHDINCRDIDSKYIDCRDINCCDIKGKYLDAFDIEANNIDCMVIEYYLFCVVFFNIKCLSIGGKMLNAKHFCLDGKIEIKGAECK